ncbi:MAG: hypothetical protein JXA99_17795 [Candidatus Lokiarchaeota archaeon]|nr:hypothetical protein [Candidatus Lokiarchaeota archaeon]
MVNQINEFIENLKFQIERRENFLKTINDSFRGQTQDRFKYIVEKKYHETYTELLNEFLGLIRKKESKSIQ